MNVRRITVDGVGELESLLEMDPLKTFFLQSHLEQDGLCSQTVGFWGTYHKDDLLAAAVNCQTGFLSYASVFGISKDAVTSLGYNLRRESISVVHGRRDLVNAFADGFKPSRIRSRGEYLFYSLDVGMFQSMNSELARKAEEADLERLINFYEESELDIYKDRTRLAKVVSYLFRRGSCFVVDRDGLLVSSVLTTAETHDIGYCDWGWTVPAYRRHGYQSAALSALINWLHSQGKKAVGIIAPDNIQERRIAERVGARVTDDWSTLSLHQPGSRRKRLMNWMRRWLSQ